MQDIHALEAYRDEVKRLLNRIVDNTERTANFTELIYDAIPEEEKEDKTHSRETTEYEKSLLDELARKDEEIRDYKNSYRTLDELLKSQTSAIKDMRCCGNCMYQLKCLRTHETSHAFRIQGVGICESWGKTNERAIELI